MVVSLHVRSWATPMGVPRLARESVSEGLTKGWSGKVWSLGNQGSFEKGGTSNPPKKVQAT